MGGAGALVLAIGCLIVPEPSVRLLAPVLFYFSRVSLRGRPVSRIEWAVLLGSTLFAFGGILLGVVPRVWLTLNHLLGAITERITSVLGGNVRLGLSAIPMGTTVLVTLILLSAFPKGWQQLRLVWPIHFLVLMTSIVTMGLLTENGTLAVDMAWIVCLTMSAVSTLVLLLSGWWSLTQLETEEKPTATSGLALSGMAVLLVVILVGTYVPFHSDPRPGEILMVTAPDDFDPSGAYRAIPPQPQPLHDVGMFGQLPQVIRKLGYPVQVQVGMPTAEQLTGVRVVCLFAPSATWAAQRQSLTALQEFVMAGGSLLVFAEHTNYQTSALVLNDLLAPFRIAVNFDTTNGGVGEDLRGVRLWRSEIREALRNLAAFPYNRGASLTLSGDALRQGEVVPDDLGLERAIARWVIRVERGAEHGDSTAAGRDRARVCRGVDAVGEAAHDDPVVPRQPVGNLPGGGQTGCRGLARSNDRHARPGSEQPAVTAQVDVHRRVPAFHVVEGAEQFVRGHPRHGAHPISPRRAARASSCRCRRCR